MSRQWGDSPAVLDTDSPRATLVLVIVLLMCLTGLAATL